jgi:hypothetical protein
MAVNSIKTANRRGLPLNIKADNGMHT